MLRKQYAANFYAGASSAKIDRFLRGFTTPSLDTLPVAGIVPHAGWDYSGAVAAKVFRTIQSRREPKTCILFGTVHQGIAADAVYSRGSWQTPFGEVAIDEDLADGILERVSELAVRDESAHDYEHSIEVQMPFVRHFFPQAAAVPIAVLPDSNAVALGRRIGEFVASSGADAVVIGTTDLTHYGRPYMFSPKGVGPDALDWMKRNDARIIELAAALRAEDIVPEARTNSNACGAGAMAATVAAARALGCAAGLTIEYTTSYDVAPEPEFRLAVGYVGMVFCGS